MVRAVVVADIAQNAVCVLIGNVAVGCDEVRNDEIRPARGTLADVELIL